MAATSALIQADLSKGNLWNDGRIGKTKTLSYYIWSNHSDLTRPHPKKAAEEGDSLYFREIWAGELL